MEGDRTLKSKVHIHAVKKLASEDGDDHKERANISTKIPAKHCLLLQCFCSGCSYRLWRSYTAGDIDHDNGVRTDKQDL
jgi:hypothetical protein